MTPADCDLRGLEWMPLYGGRLFGSDFDAHATDAEWRAALQLWWAAWNQVPAASLPDDDVALCRLAGYGRDVKGWVKVRSRALHGFVTCTDGRLYHRALSAFARESWERRLKDRARKAKYRKGLGVTEAVWNAMRAEVFQRDGFRCVLCGTTSDKLECDHIMPVSRGGASEVSNLQTLCMPCNKSKSNRDKPSPWHGTERGRNADMPRDGTADEMRCDEMRQDETLTKASAGEPEQTPSHDKPFKLPRDYSPSIACRDYAADKGLDPAATSESFLDYFTEGRGRSEKRTGPGWERRWRVWCNTDARRIGARPGVRPSATGGDAGAFARAAARMGNTEPV